MTNNNPYGLNEKLFVTWEAFGKPNLTRLGRTWMALVTVTPAMVDELLGLNIIRPRGKRTDFTTTTRKRYASTILRAKWLHYVDTLCVCVSGYLIQGNNRLLGVKDAGVAVGFKIEFGVPDEAEEVMGVVSPWELSDRLSEDKRICDVANLAMRVFHYGKMFHDDEVVAWIEQHRAAINYVNGVVGSAKYFSRTGVRLALIEAVERDENHIMDEFIACLLGGIRYHVPWATRLKDWITANKYYSTQDGRVYEYKCCVYVLKRALANDDNYENTRGRPITLRPATWDDANMEEIDEVIEGPAYKKMKKALAPARLRGVTSVIAAIRLGSQNISNDALIKTVNEDRVGWQQASARGVNLASYFRRYRFSFSTSAIILFAYNNKRDPLIARFFTRAMRSHLLASWSTTLKTGSAPTPDRCYALLERELESLRTRVSAQPQPSKNIIPDFVDSLQD